MPASDQIYVYRDQIYAPRATCVVHKGLFCFQTSLFYHHGYRNFKLNFALLADYLNLERNALSKELGKFDSTQG